MNVIILGSGGCVSTPGACCNCRVCTEARQKGFLMHIKLLWNIFSQIILERSNRITLSVVLNMNMKRMERYIWMFIFMMELYPHEEKRCLFA